jgi:hypothetical protein
VRITCCGWGVGASVGAGVAVGVAVGLAVGEGDGVTTTVGVGSTAEVVAGLVTFPSHVPIPNPTIPATRRIAARAGPWPALVMNV